MAAKPIKRVIYHFRTRGTGAEGVHIAGIANALAKFGYAVEFVSPTGIDPRQSAGANPFGVKAKKSLVSRLISHCPDVAFEFLEVAYNVFAGRRVAKVLSSGPCEFIYERHAFFLCATAWLASRRKIPVVIEVNELVGDQRIRKQPLLSFVARWTDRIAFKRASLIVVVSPHLKRRIEGLGVSGDKILVLPNAIAREDHSSLHDGLPVRQKLKLTESDVVVGFVGWFVEWHRLDVFMKAFADVYRSFPNTKLVLVGEGTLKDELLAQSRSLGIESAVIFVNAVPHHEVPSYIAAFDIAVVPHSNEYRSPIKLFEYMAEARAVLVPRTEPIEMVIQNKENGLLFTPLSESDIADNLKQLVGDRSLRIRLGQKARETVLDFHTWEANAERLLSGLKKDESHGVPR